jgi:phosphatidylglycerophosphatase C
LHKGIAFFDFDGTITRSDTMLELAKFSRGTVDYYAGMLLISPWLLGMKLGLISKTVAKEKFLTHFFGSTPVTTFINDCDAFNEKILPGLIRNDAMEAIKNHQGKNTPVVIVSASAENWVAPWCRKHNLQFICTRLMVMNDKITGKLEGKNCNGNEKVFRIKEQFNLNDFSTIYCYGDSRGDDMMLKLATNPYYRVFNQ